MPRCEGRQDGPCPTKACNSSVVLCQGDLMLCKECEEYRFPTVPTVSTASSVAAPSNPSRSASASASSTSASTNSTRSASGTTANNSKQPRKPQQSGRAAIKCSDTRSLRSAVNSDKTIDDNDDKTAATNDNCRTERKKTQSDDEEECIFCNETTSVDTDSIRCDVCNHLYHQQCTGLPKEVFAVLVSIIDQTGWVCRQCRVQVNNLQCSLAKVNEELADMRTSLSDVIAEVNDLKVKSSGYQTRPDQTTGSDHNTGTTVTSNVDSKLGSLHGITVGGSKVTDSHFQLEFHRTYQDITRRKQNVVVTGLPEVCDGSSTSDNMADNEAFIKFCEENLSVKPALARRGCVRLGKTDGVRPRRMLVHLMSETSATNVLMASKALRQNDDDYICRNVYFNPDLSPIEAKLAYERREKLRQRRRAATVAKQSSSLNVNAEPYVTGTFVSNAACLNVADRAQSNDDKPSTSSYPSDPSTDSGQASFFLQ